MRADGVRYLSSGVQRRGTWAVGHTSSLWTRCLCVSYRDTGSEEYSWDAVISKYLLYSAFKHVCKQQELERELSLNSDLPERVSLLGEDLEVLLGQLDGGQRLQPQVGPALDELHQRLKGVEPQPVVAVVGQVGHEDADLIGRAQSHPSWFQTQGAETLESFKVYG